MHVLGILGGVASGKSLVANQLKELGAEILDGDRTGHEVLEMPEVKQAIRDRWGEAVFSADGSVNRRTVAKIVFAPTPAGQAERNFLEQLTHPRIGLLLQQRAARLAAEGRVPAVVLDAPVMLEAGWNKFCDLLLFVDTPRSLRLQRAKTRGWSEEDFASRETIQESLEKKREIADVIIDNSGSAESTRLQVTRFWHSLVG